MQALFLSLGFYVFCPGASAAIIDGAGNVQAGVTERDIPELISYFGEEGPRANVSMELVAGFGEDAVPYLLEAAEAGTNSYQALFTISKVHSKKSVQALLKHAMDGSSPLQGFSQVFLKGYGDFAAPEVLTALDSWAAAKIVSEVLADAEPSKETLARVRQLISNGKPYEKAAAASLAGAWKDEASAKGVERLFSDEDPRVRKSAISGYRVMYENAPQKYDQAVVLAALKDPEAANRDGALYIVRKLPTVSPEVPEVLGSMLKDEKDPVVFRNAVVTAGRVKAQALVQPLIGVLKSGADLETKEAAVYSLGELKASEAVPDIVEFYKTIEKPTVFVQKTFYLSLVSIGKPVDLRPFLPRLFDNTKHGSLLALLDLIGLSASPGDKETVSALERFLELHAEKDPMLAEKTTEILKKLK